MAIVDAAAMPRLAVIPKRGAEQEPEIKFRSLLKTGEKKDF